MSRVLFLVHGMGANAPGWSARVKEKLNEVALRYPGFRREYPSGDMTDLVEVVEITYDDCFSRYVNDWDESLAALEEFVPPNELHAGEPLDDFSKVISWVRDDAHPTERSFFWSHAVDVLLYRFFPLVTDEVRATVLDQMAARLARPNVQGSVLAHSLGTRVALDCLHLLGTVPFGSGESFLASNGYFLDAVFTVANVSAGMGRVRRGDPPLYQSIVHPLTTPRNVVSAPGYCGAFFDYRHALDPFTAAKPFAPQGWGSDYVTPARAFDDLAPDWNVHGFTHYLEHPAVHVPIINAMLAKADPLVSQAELAEAIGNYRAPALPPCQQVVQRFVTRIEELAATLRTTGGDVATFIIAAAQFYAAIQEARDACR